MGKSPSIIKQSLDRLNARMAIGQSRYEAKQEMRAQNPTAPSWTVSDNKIHSYASRTTYQQQSLQFVTWARDAHGVRSLDTLDVRRGELVKEYLQRNIAAGKSPYTLQTQRAALRTFFADRTVGAGVDLPTRSREGITRSRGAAARDGTLSVSGNQQLTSFLKASGLRRSEIRDLRTSDIRQVGERIEVTVRNGKGGKARDVQIVRGGEEAIKSAIEGKQSGVKVFERIPSHMDVHSLRREFAQSLYKQLSGRELPPAEGRLKASDYDAKAAMQVSRALGHNRLDVVLNHYIR